MLAEIKETPVILKFLITVGMLEIFFNSTMPNRIGIDPHWLLPLFGFFTLAVIIWIIMGMRNRTRRSEPVE